MKSHKIYDRKLKKWVEEDKPVGSLKKPETCKGGRPHEWVLLIPSMISRHKPFSKDEVARYYELEAKREKNEKIYNEELAKIGIDSSLRWSYRLRKFYKCAKCFKEKYE